MSRFLLLGFVLTLFVGASSSFAEEAASDSTQVELPTFSMTPT